MKYPKTIYRDYTLNELHALFNSDNWRNHMNFSERLDACQEVENRYAAENGVPPCTVRHEPMDDVYYGEQRGSSIYLNTYLLKYGAFYSSYIDEYGVLQTKYTQVEAPGWNILDTVYHEGTHGIQWYQGRSQSVYIDPSTDGDLYRIQANEKEAYAKAQIKTFEAIRIYEQETGIPDPEIQGYILDVERDSYSEALKDAAEYYNDPNIEDTLQRVIEDHETGYRPDNPSSNYQEISDLIAEQQNMSPAERHFSAVSLGSYQYDEQADNFVEVADDAGISAEENLKQLNESMDRNIDSLEEINSSLHETREKMEHMDDADVKMSSSDESIGSNNQEENNEIDMTY